MLTRRHLLKSAALWPACYAADTTAPDWGGPVRDIHLHPRPDVDGNFRHLEGCGVSHAILLAQATDADHIHAIQQKYPGKFRWGAASDVTKPTAAATLTTAVKQGAIVLGELKYHVAANGPEMNRIYSLAADLQVPILMHFQEYPHFEGEGNWNTGIKSFGAVLKAHPKVRFIAHADAFWANMSADYANQSAYPTGPIRRGGISDQLLADYPNFFGDLSANSGNNCLSRDPEFTRDFLVRHQDKLMFGSDCGCTDGAGSGNAQPNNPAATRLAGKCVARETLALLKRSTTPEIFRKLTWENSTRLFHL